jgi:DNA polymerase/3'-5' exonuclease PolX
LKTFLFVITCSLLFAACSIYKFNDTSIPAEIKTIKLAFIENKARYINPQLAPKLNDRLQQKIVGQTRLTRSTSDDADYVITGSISDYSVTTSGITNQQASINRLNVGVRLMLKNNKTSKETPIDVSKSFEFPGTQTINQVEQSLTDEIVRGMTDEIFNKLFSDW